MIARVLRFVRLPLLLLLIFAVARFALGANLGALSRRIGGFGWGGTALVGYSIGLWGQILIFVATWLSFVAGIEASYFRHWDALNVPEGTVVTLAAALSARAGGLVVGPLIAIVPALIGRVASALAPEAATR